MTLRQWTTPFLIAASLSMGLAHAHADAAHVKADAAWARASVPGQQATGAFMRLTAEEPLRLVDRKSTRLNSSHLVISYAVFCLKKKNLTGHIGRRLSISTTQDTAGDSFSI